MTDMRRITISIPDELDEKIVEIRKEDRFVRCTYSEVVRQILINGLEKLYGDTLRGKEALVSISDETAMPL